LIAWLKARQFRVLQIGVFSLIILQLSLWIHEISP